jgi:hypothetical protein
MTESYKIIKDDSEVVFIIKRRPNWLILVTAGLWSIGWFGMILTIAYGLITNPAKLDIVILSFILFFCLGGLLIVKIFLWHLRGKEKITLTEKELQINKTGSILSFPAVVKIKSIQRISITTNPALPRWMIFWGLAGGKIEIICDERSKYFGQTLTVIEASQIIESIKSKIVTFSSSNAGL